MKRQIILLLTILLLTGTATAQEKRDPLKWPFSKTSIWNMPVHNNAVLVPANIQPKKAWSIGPTEDEDVIILTPDEPLITMYRQGWESDKRCVNLGSYNERLPVPTSLIVRKGGTPNHSAAILMPDWETFYQTQPFDKCEEGSVAYSMYKYPSVSMFSDGTEGAHGGSGLSSIGGTVRLGEVVPGGEIRHALKMNLYAKTDLYFSNDDPDGKPGYRWPAIKADGYASPTKYAGTNPVLQMGSLLVLPPDFDIESLSTEPAKIFARAFMNYGAYVVDDTAWDVWAIPTEKGSEGSVLSEFKKVWGYDFVNKDSNHPWSKDMQNILLALHVVDNNSPDNIGGGSTTDWENRRAPMAPDFIERADSVTGVRIYPTSALMAIDGTKQLTATVIPSFVTNKQVSWSSSNPSVATIDSKGVVWAVGEGTATITVRTEQSNYSAICEITVTTYGGHLVIPAKIEAENFSDMYGVETEATSDTGGGLNITNINQGDWMDYEIHVPETGTYAIDLRLASQNTGRKLFLMIESDTLATINVPKTGGWQTWQTVSTDIYLNEGNQILRILVGKSVGYNSNINWFEIKKKSVNVKVSAVKNLKMFPNPLKVGEPLIIEFDGSDQDYSLEIYDVEGRLLQHIEKYNNNLISFDKKGVYVVSIKGEGNIPAKEFRLLVN